MTKILQRILNNSFNEIQNELIGDKTKYNIDLNGNQCKKNYTKKKQTKKQVKLYQN